MRVFIDSNIPMYAAGGAHPHKDPSLQFLARAHRREFQAVTSTEVLQEIVHRYHRLGRPEVARRVYSLVVQLCGEVLPVTIADTDGCVELLKDVGGSVRDALHVAVMRNNDVHSVATYDSGFEVFGVQRFPLDGVAAG
jgi:predicted nucleic acid-binding protein